MGLISFQATTSENLDALLADLEWETEDIIEAVLIGVAEEALAWLKSHTSEMRPPAKTGEGDRLAHPGHWADVTGQLVNSYSYRVVKTRVAVILVLQNNAEYAVFLENRHGYFVLGPAIDPGGIVETAMREALARIAPNWKLV